VEAMSTAPWYFWVAVAALVIAGFAALCRG
jgi:hypothetical protein